MEKLNSIIIKNFRVHSNTEITNIESFLALLGKNDAGKSSILEALDVLFNGKRIQTTDYNLDNQEIIIECVFDNGSISKTNNEPVVNVANITIPKFLLFSTDNLGFSSDIEEYTIDDMILVVENQIKRFIRYDYDEVYDFTDGIKSYLEYNENELVKLLDNWKDLLTDFNLDSKNIIISNRGAGVKRICAFYFYLMQCIMKTNNENYIFAIDEPEISLHPMQQRKFAEILQNVSNNYQNIQIIITTHSPYVVKALGNDNVNNIKILKKIGDNVKVDTMGEKIINYGAGSTYISLNEINYRAFDEASIEYHIELFGYIHERLKEKHSSDSTFEHIWNYNLEKYDKNGSRIKVDSHNDGKSINEIAAVDAWLVNASNESINSYQLDGKYICKWYKYDRDSKIYVEEKKRSLPHCVRNWIDHPLKGNSTNANYNTAYVNNKQYGDDKIIAESISIMEKAIVKNNLNIFPVSTV